MTDVGESQDAHDVVLLTRPGCHLCEDARVVVADVTSEVGVGFREVSIDDDPQYERFAMEIPVVLVDGVQRDFWRIDSAHLRRVLTS